MQKYKTELEGKGGIYSKIISDSVSEKGKRITSFELRFPRFILAEYNTHRQHSRNVSSSRAIPVNRMLDQVLNDPAMPIHWGKNQRGMQAYEELESGELYWSEAAQAASKIARQMMNAGYHKQIVNRLLEPFQFVKSVLTATELENFFRLRDHHAAQPEIKELAVLMKQTMNDSEPQVLKENEWHLPYVPYERVEDGHFVFEDGSALPIRDGIFVSGARCARVSYDKHDSSTPTLEEDRDLFAMLVRRPYDSMKGVGFSEDDPIHASPSEHQAYPMADELFKDKSKIMDFVTTNIDDDPLFDGITHLDRNMDFWSANFNGWVQLRQLIQQGKFDITF